VFVNMYYEDVKELYDELDGEMELVLAYCGETELESLPWEELVELAEQRDEEAAAELEAEFNG